MVSRLLLIVVVSAACALVRAQGDDAHGWLAPHSLEGSGGTLLHVPPRTAGAARAGSAIAVKVLDRTPTRVAHWGDGAYLLYGHRADRAEVYSVRAVPVGVSGAWLVEPASGATAEPSLDLAGAELRDGAGSADGLAVLGFDEGWRLWVLGPAGWEARALPEGVGPGAGVWLVAGSARVTLLVVGEGASRWRLDGDRWERAPLTLPEGFDARAVGGVFECAGDVCVALERRDEAGTRVGVWSLGPGLVGRLGGLGVDGELAGMTEVGGGRLVLLSEVSDPEASGPSEPIRRWEVAELSLVTGGVLYRGQPRHPSLDIGDEVRLLSLVMLAVMGFMLFYLLRPVAGAAGPVVPAGYVLAPAGRRVLGGAIDALLVGGAVAAVTGVPLADVVLVAPLFGTATGVMSLVLAVSLGVVYSTLAEWLWGRTLGKLVLGMRVVSVDPARARPGLMRSGARNVFRWALPPWAVLGLGGQDLRHRGDQVAGAAVVVRDRRGS